MANQDGMIVKITCNIQNPELINFYNSSWDDIKKILKKKIYRQ